MYPSRFDVPLFVTEPVKELLLFDDSWQCQLENYRYITCETKGLKKHWREEHGWMVQQGHGGWGQPSSKLRRDVSRKPASR